MKRLPRLLALACLALASSGLALEPAGSSLGTIKRVYVDSFGNTLQAVMLHDMVIASLAGSGFFAITENPDHADAVLRGSADDQVFMEKHHSSDSITAGLHSGTSDNYTSKYDHTSSSKASGLNIGQNESMNSEDRKHEASASVRLVNRDGDVIWSTTQESGGAKFRSSSADVADKIFRKLSADLQRARALAASGTDPAASDRSAAMQAGMPIRKSGN
jgi:hypothetical protein